MKTTIIAAALVCLMALTTAKAEEPPAPAAETSVNQSEATAQGQSLRPHARDGKWHFSLTPYGWIPVEVKGTARIKDRSARFDLDTGDLIDLVKDRISMLVELHAELSRDRFSLFADTLYVDLSDTRTGRATEQDITFQQGLFEFGAAYAVVDESKAGGRRLRIEPLVGARTYYVATKITGSQGILDVDDSDTWVDGFVGVRGRVDLNQTYGLFARGDVGAGGSKLAWNALGGLDIRVAKAVSLIGGYRILDWKHSNGDFSFDERIHGPFVGAQFRF